MGPRFLYGHGFASGRESTKGRAIAAHFDALGVRVERLDLRVPSFEHLRLSAMIDVVTRAIGGESDRAVLMGSSLGGLTVARVAERDPRACALVLLAPAFRIVSRWRERLGEERLRTWQTSDRLEVDDHATGGKSVVDFGFMAELERLEPTVGPRSLPDVRVPTLVIQGSRDDVVDPVHAREFAATRPHVRLIELDDGHELTASISRIVSEIHKFLVPFGVPWTHHP